jgi:cleavage and polyadenylation specificity factor subunit 1
MYDRKADKIIDSFEIPPYELVTCMQVMPLEVSEITHKHKLLVTLGTISQRAENYAAKGCIYVLQSQVNQRRARNSASSAEKRLRVASRR